MKYALAEQSSHFEKISNLVHYPLWSDVASSGSLYWEYY